MGANTELNQLLRLPFLIHHLLDHHNNEPDETFADLLNQHYSDYQSHSGNDDHDNLPFKTTDYATAQVSLAFVNPNQFSIPRPSIFYDKISPFHNEAFYSFAVVGNIWQPPKFS